MSKIIPKAVLEQIRDANDIVDVVGSYIQLKRGGSAFKALCPFHKEKTPSFSVNAQRQIFHCFGCGEGGDVFKFVMLYENVDFSTAARLLAQRAGVRVEWSEGDGEKESNKDSLLKIHEDIAMLYHRALLESDSAGPAREYLAKRELDGQTAKDFLIGYAPDSRDALARWAQKKKIPLTLLEAAGLIMQSDRGDGYYERFRNRLMFPIRDELGRVVGFSGRLLEKSEKLAKYVNSPETAVFKKGRILYALDKARRDIIDSKVAILCEGQIDVIRCHIAGIHTAIAAQGTALTEDHARLLKRYADSVVVVLDSDKAGEDAALRSSEVLLGAGLSIRIAALPKGDDPDTLIRGQGAAAFLKVVDEAKSVLDFQIDVLRSREDISDEAALMRVARAVLETVARSPTAVQRDQMIHVAARALKIDETALREDLQRLLRKRQPAARETAKDKPPVGRTFYPHEEIALAELLAHHPDVADLIGNYLPLEYITDPFCRTIVERLVTQPDDPTWSLVQELSEEDEECRRLAAQIQSAPKKVVGLDASHLDAAKDLILVLWRKHFLRRREELKKTMARAAPADQGRLDLECKQMTLDIQRLGQSWDAALPILEL